MLNINLQMETMVRKQRKLRSKGIKHERQAIPSPVEMGHHALALEAPLLDGGEKWLNGYGGEGLGGLRGKGMSRHPRAA